MTEEVDIISMEPLSGIDFDSVEMQKFESAWRAVVRYYNRVGMVRRYDDALKNAVLGLAKDAKKRFDGSRFQGLTPREGFGMQPIHVRDVNQTNIQDWYAVWATAGWREWLGNVGPDGGVAGATTVVTIDANDNYWHVAAWGVLSLDTDPVFQTIRPMMEKKEVGDHDVRMQLAGSEDGYADFGRIYYHTGKPAHSLSYGARIRAVTVGQGHLQLVGVTFGDATRFFQTGVNDRRVARAS